MRLRLIMACAAAGMLAPASPSQPAADRPRFEVASLKPNNGCENRGGNLSPSPGRLALPCITPGSLIRFAYGTFADGATISFQPLRVEGAPGWTESEYYNLEAKADGPVRTEMLAGPMLQVFLEERFQLRTHREAREMPVYALTVGKSGLKTPPLADGACTPIDLTHPPPPPAKGDPPPNLCGLMILGRDPKGTGATWMEVRGATLTEFAQRLSGRVDRPVVDKTGIAGRYNFRLDFMPDTPGRGAPGAGDAGNPANLAPERASAPSIFDALQEQLGMKLTPEKGPVSYLVIDHMEKPTAN